jgi:hypothetical protein
MRAPSGKLLGEIDPQRFLLRFKVKGQYELIDLTQYLATEKDLEKPRRTANN